MALEAEREEGGNRTEEVYGHERERDPDHRAVLVDLVILRSFGVGVYEEGSDTIENDDLQEGEGDQGGAQYPKETHAGLGR